MKLRILIFQYTVSSYRPKLGLYIYNFYYRIAYKPALARIYGLTRVTEIQ